MVNILDAVREEFFNRLQTNTTWGRNQVQALYTEVERNVLSSIFTTEDIKNKFIDTANKVTNSIRKVIYEQKHITTMNITPDVDYGDENPFKNDNEINKGY